MGTSYHVTWLGGDLPAEEAQAGVEQILEAVNASMSTYRDDALISEFNRAPTGEWVSVDSDFLAVFQMARTLSLASDGAYDATVTPVVNIWGFGPDGGDSVPEAAAIDAARALVGQAAIDVDSAALALRKNAPRELDFSSIAKGYAVDLVSEWLNTQGVENYLVEIGGEIRVAGHSPRGTPWRVAIERPDPGARAPMAALEISDIAVATSGDYRNFFEVDGFRYSHSIDPRTGWPVRHELVSVTVLHRSSALADGWATALTILGADAALRVAEAQGLAVYLVSRQDGELVIAKTPAIEQWIR